MDGTNEPLHVLEVAPTPDLDHLNRNAAMYRYGLVRAAAVDALADHNDGPWRLPASRNARASAGLSRKSFSRGLHECLRKRRLTVIENPCPDSLSVPARGQAVGSLTIIKMPPCTFVPGFRDGYGLRHDRSAAAILDTILRATPFGRWTLSATIEDLATWSGYHTPRTITRALDTLSNARVLTYHADADGAVRIELTLLQLLPFVFPNPYRHHRGH